MCPLCGQILWFTAVNFNDGLPDTHAAIIFIEMLRHVVLRHRDLLDPPP